jgi:hypothetical protein
MQLEVYSGKDRPQQQKLLALKPKLVAWTSRVIRQTPARADPLFKIDARLDLRDIDNKAFAETLRAYAAQLQKLTIYLLYPYETPRLAPWAVGRFDLDEKSAYMFFHDFIGASNGMLMLNLMQTAGAATDLYMSVTLMKNEGGRLAFAVSEYDLGIHNRIG